MTVPSQSSFITETHSSAPRSPLQPTQHPVVEQAAEGEREQADHPAGRTPDAMKEREAPLLHRIRSPRCGADRAVVGDLAGGLGQDVVDDRPGDVLAHGSQDALRVRGAGRRLGGPVRELAAQGPRLHVE